jgi:hypothetical protein
VERVPEIFPPGHASCRALLEKSGFDMLLQACCGILITLPLFRFDGGVHAATHNKK